MKIRSLLTIVAMLSMFVFIGIAHAELDVNDAVPGQDITIPFVCAQSASDGLDTLWAIAETTGGAKIPDTNNVVCAKIVFFDRLSNPVWDEAICWTKWDVISDNCKAAIVRMPGSAQNKLKWTEDVGEAGTKDVFEGYVQYQQQPNTTNPIADRFVSWAYLTDLGKGFASGLNGISSEQGVGQRLEEAAGSEPVTAETVFPRYFLLNGNADTWNWWILLLGRNELSLIDPQNLSSWHRILDCVICDEQEHCPSSSIDIPVELNIINVQDHLTPGGYPKFGFAICHIAETGNLPSSPGITYSITGTFSSTYDSISTTGYYSLFGWSYQRNQQDTAQLSWDVIHEMHRLYCNGWTDNSNTEGICEFSD